MNNLHERPGVYSVYDTSSVLSGGRAARTIGVAARAAKGEADKAVTVTGYAAGAAAFGEDETPGMSTLLRLLFAGGASARLTSSETSAPAQPTTAMRSWRRAEASSTASRRAC